MAGPMTDRLEELGAAIDKRAARFEEKTAKEPVDAPEGTPEGAPSGDLAPLVDKLGVDEEKARLILECAKQFDWLKGMSADDLAQHLSGNADDMQMIMMEVARKQDAAGSETTEGPEYGNGTAG